jgi:hypothetical protein
LKVLLEARSFCLILSRIEEEKEKKREERFILNKKAFKKRKILQKGKKKKIPDGPAFNCFERAEFY